MKGKRSPDDYFDELKNEDRSFLELTKTSDDYQENYSDPEKEAKTWCSYMERGFRASRILAGTDTATRINSPAHFPGGGTSIEALQPDELAGRYYFIDADAGALNQDMIAAYKDEPFLFIRGEHSVTELPEDLFMLLLELHAKIWIAAGEFIIKGEPGFFFKKKLAEKGKFLVENLEMDAARSVTGNGYASALPLGLMKTPGAPCRLFVLPDR